MPNYSTSTNIYSSRRICSLFIQQPYKENKEEHIAEILLLTEKNSEYIEQNKDYQKKNLENKTTSAGK